MHHVKIAALPLALAVLITTAACRPGRPPDRASQQRHHTRQPRRSRSGSPPDPTPRASIRASMWRRPTVH